MWLQPGLTTLAKKQGDLTPPLENMRVKWRHDRETSNSFIAQSLEVSKIKKNKKNFEKFIDDQNFSKFFLFFFIFETSSDCVHRHMFPQKCVVS